MAAKTERKLTAKQLLFCKEYLVDCNGAAAALRAGYSPKGINACAARLLANVSIQKEIERLMAERNDELIAKADEVLKKLTAILRREEAETVVSRRKTKKTYLDERGKKVVEEVEEPVTVEVPAKLSDVVRAAELLGKRLALWTEKVKHEGGVTVEAGESVQRVLAETMTLDEMMDVIKGAAALC